MNATVVFAFLLISKNIVFHQLKCRYNLIKLLHIISYANVRRCSVEQRAKSNSTIAHTHTHKIGRYIKFFDWFCFRNNGGGIGKGCACTVENVLYHMMAVAAICYRYRLINSSCKCTVDCEKYLDYFTNKVEFWQINDRNCNGALALVTITESCAGAALSSTFIHLFRSFFMVRALRPQRWLSALIESIGRKCKYLFFACALFYVRYSKPRHNANNWCAHRRLRSSFKIKNLSHNFSHKVKRMPSIWNISVGLCASNWTEWGTPNHMVIKYKLKTKCFSL